MKQEPWEIQEIIDCLKGKSLISSAKCTLGGASTVHPHFSDFVGKSQGGHNNAPIGRLELIDTKTVRDYEAGKYFDVETWLVQWNSNDSLEGASLLMFEA